MQIVRGSIAPVGGLIDGTNASVGSGAGAALASSTAISEVMLQADPDNTDDVFVGNSTSQSWQLTPGQELMLRVNDLALIYVRSASGTQTVNYLAVP